MVYSFSGRYQNLKQIKQVKAKRTLTGESIHDKQKEIATQYSMLRMYGFNTRMN